MPPVSPMLAKSVKAMPADASYEPKWDGFRSICFRDGDEVELGSRNEKPMTRYFPELVAAVQAELPRRCVIDGEIVIARTRGASQGLDFKALQQRIHPADSRVRMLAEHTPASFIAFDLLALNDDDYTRRPFTERRAALVDALKNSGPSIHVTPATTDLETAQMVDAKYQVTGVGVTLTGRNGGGDSYFTDGEVWILRLVTACQKRTTPADIIPSPPATEMKDQIWHAVANALGK